MRLQAEFVSAALNLTGCPRWRRHEIAVAGRSNVGKSSLLNVITGVKGLARTSKTPGRTRSLNFFAVHHNAATFAMAKRKAATLTTNNDPMTAGLALVDLPGYGYAKMSHDDAARIAAMLRDYLLKRPHLLALVLLVDARRELRDEELELAALLRQRGRQLIVVATKADKLRNRERAAAHARLVTLDPDPIMCSALTGEGLDELRRRIFAVADAARPRDDDEIPSEIPAEFPAHR